MALDLWFAVPGDIETRTGGTIYDRHVLKELRGAGWSVMLLCWPPRFPYPTAEDKIAVRDSLAACPDRALVLVDGLAYGVIPEIVSAENKRLRFATLVHHPLALEAGLSPTEQDRFVELERRALAMARAVIATSDTTAAALAKDYGVPIERLTVARPGVEPVSPIPPKTPAPGGEICILAVGTVTPRKGYDVLIEALSRIAGLPWRCVIAGSLERSPETTAQIRWHIHENGLDDRVVLLGERAEIADLYRKANIFVSCSRHEGYGMALAEAMTFGLPIVATNAGAIPELVPMSAGILTPPDDPDATAAALARLIDDSTERIRLAAGAWKAGAALPGWDDTAIRIAAALQAM